MVPIEIERKFTIKYLPSEIESIKKIEQKHIYRDTVCSIRVRKSEDLSTNNIVYTHTIKAKGEKKQKYSIYELEKNITEEEYNSLEPFNGSKKIEKYRLVIPIDDNLKAEVDVFEGGLSGLIITEVEFRSVEQAENFKMPDWFQKSVPHTEFSNRMLSTKTKQEILESLDKTQINTNNEIYQNFKKLIINKYNSCQS